MPQQQVVLADVAARTVIVQDRYTLYDKTAFAHIARQLCIQHLMRDFGAAA